LFKTGGEGVYAIPGPFGGGILLRTPGSRKWSLRVQLGTLEVRKIIKKREREQSNASWKKKEKKILQGEF
jgi:hypothetical protein